MSSPKRVPFFPRVTEQLSLSERDAGEKHGNAGLLDRISQCPDLLPGSGLGVVVEVGGRCQREVWATTEKVTWEWLSMCFLRSSAAPGRVLGCASPAA